MPKTLKEERDLITVKWKLFEQINKIMTDFDQTHAITRTSRSSRYLQEHSLNLVYEMVFGSEEK